MKLSELIAATKQVRWSNSSETSVLLSELGIQHGFRGKRNLPPLETLAPHYAKQVHGTTIIEADHSNTFELTSRPEADGIYTGAHHTVAIRTADCLPILAASTKKDFACALHAGWRGFTAGILLRGADLCAQSGDLRQFRFIIGPAISREMFEVGPEVIAALSATSCGLNDAAQALTISKGRADRWHVDLQLAAVCQLILKGALPENIEVIRACTFLDAPPEEHQKNWNSYRRDGVGCASNWTWIKL